MSVPWPSEGPRKANGVADHYEYLPDRSDISAGVHRCTICGDLIHTTKRVREHGCTPEMTCPVCGEAVRPHWTPGLTDPPVNVCETCGYQFTNTTSANSEDPRSVRAGADQMEADRDV